MPTARTDAPPSRFASPSIPFKAVVGDLQILDLQTAKLGSRREGPCELSGMLRTSAANSANSHMPFLATCPDATSRQPDEPLSANELSQGTVACYCATSDEFLRNLSSRRAQNSICDSRKPDSTVMLFE